MGLNPPSSPFKKAFAFLTVALMLGPVALAGNSYRVLHAFVGGNDGSAPFAGLVMNKQGSLYGTTWGAGAHNLGTIFELTPHIGGHWTETVLHSFEAAEGAYPVAGLVFDPAGNFYGATKSGGSNGVGTIFGMMHQSDGWTLNVLDNYGSNGWLVLDKAYVMERLAMAAMTGERSPSCCAAPTAGRKMSFTASAPSRTAMTEIFLTLG